MTKWSYNETKRYISRIIKENDLNHDAYSEFVYKMLDIILYNTRTIPLYELNYLIEEKNNLIKQHYHFKMIINRWLEGKNDYIEIPYIIKNKNNKVEIVEYATEYNDIDINQFILNIKQNSQYKYDKDYKLFNIEEIINYHNETNKHTSDARLAGYTNDKKYCYISDYYNDIGRSGTTLYSTGKDFKKINHFGYTTNYTVNTPQYLGQLSTYGYSLSIIRVLIDTDTKGDDTTKGDETTEKTYDEQIQFKGVYLPNLEKFYIGDDIVKKNIYSCDFVTNTIGNKIYVLYRNIIAVYDYDGELIKHNLFKESDLLSKYYNDLHLYHIESKHLIIISAMTNNYYTADKNKPDTRILIFIDDNSLEMVGKHYINEQCIYIEACDNTNEITNILLQTKN